MDIYERLTNIEHQLDRIERKPNGISVSGIVIGVFFIEILRLGKKIDERDKKIKELEEKYGKGE